jgi:RNA-directed DNA polymerase
MTRLGLTINEAKTSLRNARRERFDFLGYSFGPHWFKANGKWYLGASPSKKSVQRLKTKVGDLLPSTKSAVSPGTRRSSARAWSGPMVHEGHSARRVARTALPSADCRFRS